MVYRYFLLSTVATKYNFLSERLIGRVELYIWATVLRNGDQNSIFICAHVIREKRKTFDHNIFFYKKKILPRITQSSSSLNESGEKVL